MAKLRAGDGDGADLAVAGNPAAAAAAASKSPTSPIAIDYDYYGQEGPPEKVLVLMDGFCPYHGGYLAARARDIPGVAVVHVLSDYLRGYLLQQGGESAEDLERMRMPASAEDVQAWNDHIIMGGGEGEDSKKNVRFVAVYCESDSGLADAERLRQLLGVECQDEPAVSEARRHKYLMQQTVASAGALAVAKQKLCESVDEAQAFAQELFLSNNINDSGTSSNVRCVVKPFRGVASESVHLCESIEEVVSAWDKITTTQVFGSVGQQHTNVLVQEFLDGTEYAVDVVSRNGEHKVAAIWRYVKQPANGAAFCYFKTELVDAASSSETSVIEDICFYVAASLTALGIRWGVSHTEVIVPKDGADDKRGPMLVEVNCRQHNMDFLPLTMACIGYNALDMTLAAMLGDDDDWSGFPDRPTLRAHGCMVHLVNYAASGRLKQNFHLQDMVDLPSVMDCEVYEAFCTPGALIEPTVDIRSDAGWAQLVNEDRDALQRDYEQIVEWMPTMFETR